MILDGPDGLDVAMTPAAALDTSDRPLDAAVEARGQQRAADFEAKDIASRRGGKGPDDA